MREACGQVVEGLTAAERLGGILAHSVVVALVSPMKLKSCSSSAQLLWVILPIYTGDAFIWG